MQAGGYYYYIFTILVFYYTTLNQLNRQYKALRIYHTSQQFYWTGSIQVILALRQQHFTRFHNKRCNQGPPNAINHAHALQHSPLNNFM